MIALLLIIAFAFLAATAYTFYRRQHAASVRQAALESVFMRPQSLFDERESAAETRQLLAAESSQTTAARQASLLQRASEGDLTVLTDTHQAHEHALYSAVLNALLERASNSERELVSLAAFINGHTELRGNAKLAEAYRRIWRQHPDLAATGQMLHLSAVSDDAETFASALEEACSFRRNGRLGGIKSAELLVLIESEYWVLSSGARRTGAGFILKERLAALRRELV